MTARGGQLQDVIETLDRRALESPDDAVMQSLWRWSATDSTLNIIAADDFVSPEPVDARPWRTRPSWMTYGSVVSQAFRRPSHDSRDAMATPCSSSGQS